MHTSDVNTAISKTQANNAVNTTMITEVRQLSFDIENFAGDGEILVDAIFEALDSMTEIPERLRKGVNATNCFSTCVKRHLALITEANAKVLELTASMVSQ